MYARFPRPLNFRPRQRIRQVCLVFIHLLFNLSLCRSLIAQYIQLVFKDYQEQVLIDPLLFGDFRNAAQDVEDVRIYEDLKDYDALKPIFEEVLLNYNEKHTPPMNLVLFEDALDHLTRIMRIITRPRFDSILF